MARDEVKLLLDTLRSTVNRKLTRLTEQARMVK